jgi:hypothetical protein
MIAAITISCVGAACLLLLAVLWVSSFLRLYISPDLFFAEECRLYRPSLKHKELMAKYEVPGKSQGMNLYHSRADPRIYTLMKADDTTLIQAG